MTDKTEHEETIGLLHRVDAALGRNKTFLYFDYKRLFGIALVLLVITAGLGQYNAIVTSRHKDNQLTRFQEQSDCRTQIASDTDYAQGQTIQAIGEYISVQGNLVADLANRVPTTETVQQLAVEATKLAGLSMQFQAALERRLRTLELCPLGG